jgi:hypothetical protein
VVVKYFTIRLDEKQPGHRGEYRRQQLWIRAPEKHAPKLVRRYGLFVQFNAPKCGRNLGRDLARSEFIAMC